MLRPRPQTPLLTIDPLKIAGVEFGELCRDITSQADELRFRAHGRSMRPFLRDGDLVTMRVVSPANVRVGDIVLYQTDSQLPLVHRVLRRRTIDGQILLFIRGDAARGDCDVVHASRVIARVEQVERGTRHFAPGAWHYRIPALVWASTPTLIRRPIGWVARRLHIAR